MVLGVSVTVRAISAGAAGSPVKDVAQNRRVGNLEARPCLLEHLERSPPVDDHDDAIHLGRNVKGLRSSENRRRVEDYERGRIAKFGDDFPERLFAKQTRRGTQPASRRQHHDVAVLGDSPPHEAVAYVDVVALY